MAKENTDVYGRTRLRIQSWVEERVSPGSTNLSELKEQQWWRDDGVGETAAVARAGRQGIYEAKFSVY